MSFLGFGFGSGFPSMLYISSAMAAVLRWSQFGRGLQLTNAAIHPLFLLYLACQEGHFAGFGGPLVAEE